MTTAVQKSKSLGPGSGFVKKKPHSTQYLTKAVTKPPHRSCTLAAAKPQRSIYESERVSTLGKS